MTARIALSLALVGASAACFAQTSRPTQKAPPPKPAYDLPEITPNVKWTVAQNAAQLLLDAPVQANMRLSAPTKAGILKAYGEYNAKYTEITKNPGTPDALEAALDAAMLEAANKATALLSPEEARRFSQIGIQAMGADAFRMPEVRTKLALTVDQSAKFDKLFSDLDAKQQALDTELGERLTKIPDPGPAATPDQLAAYRKAQADAVNELTPKAKVLDELKKSDAEAMLALLAPDQRSTWAAIHGEPFKA